MEYLPSYAHHVRELVPRPPPVLSDEVLCLLLRSQLLTLIRFDLLLLAHFSLVLVFFLLEGEKLVICLISEQYSDRIETEILRQNLPTVHYKVGVASLCADNTSSMDCFNYFLLSFLHASLSHYLLELCLDKDGGDGQKDFIEV